MGIIQYRPQFPFKQENLVNEVRHDKVIVDQFRKIVEQFGLYLLKEAACEFKLWVRLGSRSSQKVY